MCACSVPEYLLAESAEYNWTCSGHTNLHPLLYDQAFHTSERTNIAFCCSVYIRLYPWFHLLFAASRDQRARLVPSHFPFSREPPPARSQRECDRVADVPDASECHCICRRDDYCTGPSLYLHKRERESLYLHVGPCIRD